MNLCSTFYAQILFSGSGISVSHWAWCSSHWLISRIQERLSIPASCWKTVQLEGTQIKFLIERHRGKGTSPSEKEETFHFQIISHTSLDLSLLYSQSSLNCNWFSSWESVCSLCVRNECLIILGPSFTLRKDVLSIDQSICSTNNLFECLSTLYFVPCLHNHPSSETFVIFQISLNFTSHVLPMFCLQ